MPPSKKVKRAREADVGLGEGAVVAAQGFSLDPAIVCEPFKGKYPKFRFKCLYQDCSIVQLRIGDEVWQASSPHFRLSFNLLPVPSLQIRIPLDVEQTPEPISDLEQQHDHGSVAAAREPFKACTIKLAAARVVRATKSDNPCGRSLIGLELDPSAALLEYPAKEVPADDQMGAKLIALLSSRPLRIECVSGDRMFVDMVRDLRDYCEKIIKTGGKV
mmetsp:Transcript_158202/g.484697  ORF Transcript_158202/g.484697 Transcript_158202/m.484697 type:complete len:217 (+) Transcript_158202:145-795(+)